MLVMIRKLTLGAAASYHSPSQHDVDILHGGRYIRVNIDPEHAGAEVVAT